MGSTPKPPDADTSSQSGVLAQYLDDCWEPEEAEALLRELAAPGQGSKTGIPLCLRVVGSHLEDAEVLAVEYECDASETPGTARYLWVLWAGPRPSREKMIALFREHKDHFAPEKQEEGK
jgi:hypothetical protein